MVDQVMKPAEESFDLEPGWVSDSFLRFRNADILSCRPGI